MKINPKDKQEIVQRLRLHLETEIDKLKKEQANEFRKIIRNVFTSKAVNDDGQEQDIFLPAYIVQSLQFYAKANKDLVKEMQRSKQAIIDIEKKLNEIDGNIRYILKNVDFNAKRKD
jgi:hypothetical protein